MFLAILSYVLLVVCVVAAIMVLPPVKQGGCTHRCEQGRRCMCGGKK